MPRGARVETQLIQRVCIIQREEIPGKQKGVQETQPPPHPRMEALDCDVHIVALAERLQSVQRPPLVPELQVLDETYKPVNHSRSLTPAGLGVLR